MRFNCHPEALERYRKTTRESTFTTAQRSRAKEAFCETCRTHYKVKDKSKINKGWQCHSCRGS